MEAASAGLLGSLFRHVLSWLANLARAGPRRRRQSRQALRGVVAAARETAVYLRQMEDHDARDHAVERRLARLWTELGFALEDLGLDKLAKRCQVTGRHWSDPSRFEAEFLQKADVSLERIEHMALEILHGIER